MAREDLRPHGVGDGLDWTESQRLESARRLADSLRDNATAAIEWYGRAKPPKKKGALTLRVLIIAATSAAGVLAVLATFLEGAAGAPLIHPGWVSLAAAVSGSLWGMDRYFGFSRAWIRYTTTELQIRNALNRFNLEWVRREAVWGPGPLTVDQAAEAIGACADFGQAIDNFVAEETAQWVVDFQASMRELGAATEAAKEAAKAVTEARREADRARTEAEEAASAASLPGALNVTVTNGDEAVDGWTLAIEEGPSARCSGKTGALSDLPAGLARVTASGTIRGRNASGVRAVLIEPGRVTELELTLS